MHYRHLLNTTFECQCNQRHSVPIQKVSIDNSLDMVQFSNFAAEQFGQKKALVLADQHTESFNRKVIQALEDLGWSIKTCQFQVDGILLNTESVVGTALIKADSTIPGLINIGAGTITDLGRFIASRTDKPFIHIMTAPTMDGYASSIAAVMLGREKLIFKDCQAPRGLFADLGVLQSAPWDLIQSGYGDMLGKRTVILDWLLANNQTGEYFCPYIFDLANTSSQACLDVAAEISQRDPEAIRILIDMLVENGINMQLARDSRPTSGSEHLISHELVESALRRGEVPPSHGVTVAFGTLIATHLYEYLLNVWQPDLENQLLDQIQKSLTGSDAIRSYLEVAGIPVHWSAYLESELALKNLIRNCCHPKKKYTIFKYLSEHDQTENAIQYLLEKMR